ncbi:hypothetical protein [Kosakonia cowanii]|uniref:hypothetical protein n=1 Tax=Kosakonia cowanii TaxID=208223 RepID=UPI001CEF7469|nr:hypothetical protein [Kosakonia cowanii]
MSAIDMQPEEGTLRLMTPGEIAMARRIYGDSIVYSRVWIHCDSYLPFGGQHPQFAMTPNGELWLRKEKYVADYSKASVSIDLKHLSFMNWRTSGSTRQVDG